MSHVTYLLPVSLAVNLQSAAKPPVSSSASFIAKEYSSKLEGTCLNIERARQYLPNMRQLETSLSCGQTPHWDRTFA